MVTTHQLPYLDWLYKYEVWKQNEGSYKELKTENNFMKIVRKE